MEPEEGRSLIQQIHVNFPAKITDPEDQRIWMETSFSSIFDTHQSGRSWEGRLEGVRIVDGDSIVPLDGRGRTESACITRAYNTMVRALKHGAHLRADDSPYRITVDLKTMELCFTK